MKILLTMNLPYFPAHGGANKANRCLCEALARRGHSVVAVTPATGVPPRHTAGQLRDLLAAEGVGVERGEGADVYRLNGVEVRAVAEASRLREHLLRALSEQRPDVVLVSSEDPSQNLLSAAVGVCPERVVYLAHSPSFFPFGPWAFFPSEARAKVLTKAAAIISVSEFVARYLREWAGLDSTVIYWPAYGDGPFPLLGSFDNDFVTMVNPCAVKGLSIFSALARQLPEVSFAAVPTWGTTAEDRAELERLPNVRLLPPSDNIDEILSQTRLLLVPSLWGEAFGLVVVEAMLRGIPVLAGDSGGTVEAKLGTDFVIPVRPVERFTEQLDGSLVPTPVIPPQETKPWRDALCALLASRELYAEQSAAARSAATRFVSGLGLAPFEELFVRVAEQAARGPRRSANEARAEEAASLPSAAGAKADRIAGLTPEQRALLMLRLQKKQAARQDGGAATRPSAIRPTPRGAALPLSFAQQRLWFTDQLEPGNPAYNISGAVRFTGPLNVAALRQAIGEVVRRHEVMRTTFKAVEGQPVQVIARPAEVALPVVELAGLSRDEAQAEARRLAAEEALRPFNLERGPLVRVSLLQLGEREHVLLLSMHHIISDGWSVVLFVREVATLYGAFVGGNQSGMPELTVQYADFADWQRQWLQGEVLEGQLAYWTRQLAEAPAFLELPADRPRPPAQTFRGALEPFSLPAELSASLKALTRDEGVTLFMTLLAAFQLLLHRYTAEERCAVGTHIANRNRPGVEQLIGLFANNLVLLTDLSGDPTFRELLGRVRDAALGAYAHQDLPFEKVVEAVRPERDPSRPPLMQVLFVLQNAPRLELDLPGLKVSLLEGDYRISKFDLTLFMEEAGERLCGAAEYNTDLFDAASVRRMLDHFRNLLEEVVKDPGASLSSFTLVADAETGGDFNDDLEAF
ncbi:MAG TPA: condensation domain-containing protein [Pyrinomonadaceae bacterium]|jgi:glycosyltransferase involved in cell wall biosynthesis|nr:condensation domain-containing protein [Pyrinomonadaceae bacterium]